MEHHMLNKEQANAVTDALLAPDQDVQMATAKRRERAIRVEAARRRTAFFALVGMAAGSVVGYMASGTVFPSALYGFGVGAALGFVSRQWQPNYSSKRTREKARAA
jgi:hypothetical protein